MGACLLFLHTCVRWKKWDFLHKNYFQEKCILFFPPVPSPWPPICFEQNSVWRLWGMSQMRRRSPAIRLKNVVWKPTLSRRWVRNTWELIMTYSWFQQKFTLWNMGRCHLIKFFKFKRWRGIGWFIHSFTHWLNNDHQIYAKP